MTSTPSSSSEAIHDTDIPLDVRISGARHCCFGVAMPSIARITTDDVHQRDRDLYLTIGDKSFQLPPSLADLIRQQLDQLARPLRDRAHPIHVRRMVAGRSSCAGALAKQTQPPRHHRLDRGWADGRRGPVRSRTRSGFGLT
jgi:hypothetical protein